MSLYIPQDRELTPRERRLMDSLPQDRDLTPAERRVYNRLVNPHITIRQRISDRNNPDPPCRLLGMFDPVNMNRAYRFHARLDMAVAVFAFVVGLFLAHKFVGFMWTYPPETAAYLGVPADIMPPDERKMMTLVLAGFLAFVTWVFSNMSR